MSYSTEHMIKPNLVEPVVLLVASNPEEIAQYKAGFGDDLVLLTARTLQDGLKYFKEPKNAPSLMIVSDAPSGDNSGLKKPSDLVTEIKYTKRHPSLHIIAASQDAEERNNMMRMGANANACSLGVAIKLTRRFFGLQPMPQRPDQPAGNQGPYDLTP
jgi:hypothetical protein